jgi:ADP-dependent phosphofructokinase/glucokinase
MNNEILKAEWKKKYNVVSTQLEKLKTINSVATAFNTNIDAIYKISGEKLKSLIVENGLTSLDIDNIALCSFNKPEDTILGITKCFLRGIAEEWVTEDIKVYNWLEKNIGYTHLQMGGQGGIIANTLALLGIQNVIAHTNSHPKLQAEQFLDLENLYAFDKNGSLKKAYSIERNEDMPLIHWIIEFDKGDSFTLDGKTYTCPKSNRFIATYDPLNMNLVMNDSFVSYLSQNKSEYLLLSGFNPLLE